MPGLTLVTVTRDTDGPDGGCPGDQRKGQGCPTQTGDPGRLRQGQRRRSGDHYPGERTRDEARSRRASGRAPCSDAGSSYATRSPACPFAGRSRTSSPPAQAPRLPAGCAETREVHAPPRAVRRRAPGSSAASAPPQSACGSRTQPGAGAPRRPAASASPQRRRCLRPSSAPRGGPGRKCATPAPMRRPASVSSRPGAAPASASAPGNRPCTPARTDQWPRGPRNPPWLGARSSRGCPGGAGPAP